MTTKRAIYYLCNLFDATYTRLKIQIDTIDNKGLFFVQLTVYALLFIDSYTYSISIII